MSAISRARTKRLNIKSSKQSQTTPLGRWKSIQRILMRTNKSSCSSLRPARVWTHLSGKQIATSRRSWSSLNQQCFRADARNLTWTEILLLHWISATFNFMIRAQRISAHPSMRYPTLLSLSKHRAKKLFLGQTTLIWPVAIILAQAVSLKSPNR